MTGVLVAGCRHRDPHVHGTRQAYGSRCCNCSLCRAANADYNREWRAARNTTWVPRAGTRRRLQALAVEGWSLGELAPHFHVSAGEVWNLRERAVAGDRMLRPVAEHIAAVYDQLWHQQPTGRYQTYTRRHAERRGWAAPWQWEGVDIDDPDAVPHELGLDVVDEVAVHRAMNGDRVAATRAEQIEVIRRLAARGHTDAQIGAVLGVGRDAICKTRRRNNIESQVKAA